MTIQTIDGATARRTLSLNFGGRQPAMARARRNDAAILSPNQLRRLVAGMVD